MIIQSESKALSRWNKKNGLRENCHTAVSRRLTRYPFLRLSAQHPNRIELKLSGMGSGWASPTSEWQNIIILIMCHKAVIARPRSCKPSLIYDANLHFVFSKSGTNAWKVSQSLNSVPTSSPHGQTLLRPVIHQFTPQHPYWCGPLDNSCWLIVDSTVFRISFKFIHILWIDKCHNS